MSSLAGGGHVEDVLVQRGIADDEPIDDVPEVTQPRMTTRSTSIQPRTPLWIRSQTRARLHERSGGRRLGCDRPDAAAEHHGVVRRVAYRGTTQHDVDVGLSGMWIPPREVDGMGLAVTEHEAGHGIVRATAVPTRNRLDARGSSSAKAMAREGTARRVSADLVHPLMVVWRVQALEFCSV